MAFSYKTIRLHADVIILALMLEFLHFGIWLDFGSALSRSFLLAHLGLFLIWQPVWRNDKELAWYNGLFFILMAMGFVAWMNWWLLLGWLLMLTGFCGGRVVVHQQERYNYMIVLVLLISQLLIVCIPTLFDAVQISKNIVSLFGNILPVLPLIIIFLPVKKSQTSLQSVDLVHAIGTATLISLLTLGSLINMFQSHTDYIVALVQTLLVIGCFLLIISWLLSPRSGFSGFSQIWLRSILNIGTPFEKWLIEIANRFEQQNSPEEFLEASMEDLIALPWVAGAKWKTPRVSGNKGVETGYESEFHTDDLTVCIYAHTRIGGALYLHCQLLVQLVNNFYVAKVREKKLTQQTHLQAIHETGARVTHDIKNLLQSLHAMKSIITQDKNGEDSNASQHLLERQLPHFTQRLRLALAKLEAPGRYGTEEVYLKDWWNGLKLRNSMDNIVYDSAVSGDPLIPVDLFNSVIENLFENLRRKKQLEPDLEITLNLYSDKELLQLTITDNGKQIPATIAASILHEPIKSNNGLGIGLYQATRQAESLAYALELHENKDGRVCFKLSTTYSKTH